MPWLDEDAEPNADMWATADESPEQIIDLYRPRLGHSDATIDALRLDAPAHVPVVASRAQPGHLHLLLVHMIAETARHAGHMDVLRETIDGQRGLLQNVSNLPDVDDAWWQEYVARLRRLAERLWSRPWVTARGAGRWHAAGAREGESAFGAEAEGRERDVHSAYVGYRRSVHRYSLLAGRVRR